MTFYVANPVIAQASAIKTIRGLQNSEDIASEEELARIKALNDGSVTQSVNRA